MSRKDVYREVMLNQLEYLPIGYNWRIIAVVKDFKSSKSISVTDQTLGDEIVTFQLPQELEIHLQSLPLESVVRIFGRKEETGHVIHHVEPLAIDIEKYYTLRALETRSSF